jgi:hypothetical protein
MSGHHFFTTPYGRILVGTLLSVFVAFSGCSEPRVPVFPVSGKVTYQGKPPVGAQVVLHAQSVDETYGVAPVGVVKSDGTFAITAYEPEDGAPEGEYVATIQWFKTITNEGGTGAGPNVLPEKYASAQTSPIKVKVRGPTQIPPIAIQ